MIVLTYLNKYRPNIVARNIIRLCSHAILNSYPKGIVDTNHVAGCRGRWVRSTLQGDVAAQIAHREGATTNRTSGKSRVVDLDCRL